MSLKLILLPLSQCLLPTIEHESAKIAKLNNVVDDGAKVWGLILNLMVMKAAAGRGPHSSKLATTHSPPRSLASYSVTSTLGSIRVGTGGVLHCIYYSTSTERGAEAAGWASVVTFSSGHYNPIL